MSVLKSETPARGLRSAMREPTANAFVGFTWGPSIDAFPLLAQEKASPTDRALPQIQTPRPAFRSAHSTPLPRRFTPSHAFVTPMRQVYHSAPRPSTMARSSERRRDVSDREAMQQLVECVGASARKKVLASGRKPRILPSSTSIRHKQLRFDPAPKGISRQSLSLHDSSASSDSFLMPVNVTPLAMDESESEAGGPPSPSPSPRPSSAMSRRSSTPTVSTPSWRRDAASKVSSSGSGSQISQRVQPKPMIVQPPAVKRIPVSQLRDPEDIITGLYQPLDNALELKHAMLMRDIQALSRRVDIFVAHTRAQR